MALAPPALGKQTHSNEICLLLPDQLNTFEDLSGTATPVRELADFALSGNSTSDNPYDVMINNCRNDPTAIHKAYDTHRRTRNALSRHKLLTDAAPIRLDHLLLRSHVLQDGTVDHRNCLVWWIRPPQAVRDFIETIQARLKEAAPNIWLMPNSNFHVTALEVSHTQTPEVIADLVKEYRPFAQDIADHTYTHHAKLVKPMLSFDGSACAISYVPAAAPETEQKDDKHDYTYTYHHLRRDLFNLSEDTGVKVESRYTVPSAHITIGRFITLEDHIPSIHTTNTLSNLSVLAASSQADLTTPVSGTKITQSRMDKWVDTLDAINRDLEKYTGPGSEWIVGEEKGLECRIGRLWYGGGETIALGRGIIR